MADGPPPSDTRQAYYDQAASWSAEVSAALRASRRIAWIAAAVAAVIAIAEAVALAALAPLKTVVPYTILVDRQTGYVQTLRGLSPGAITQDSAVTQSFLVRYVIARETFDATDLLEKYGQVMLWSSQATRDAYEREMRRSNPASPLNLYAASTVVSTQIKSVSLLSPTSALVRFDTTRRDAAGIGETRSWVAVIAFRYTGAPMTMNERFTNPLGFQVTSYRRDAEAIADEPPPVAIPLPTLPPAAAASRAP